MITPINMYKLFTKKPSKLFQKLPLYCCRCGSSMSRPNKGALPTSFDPEFVQKDWREFWEQNNYFQKDPSSKRKDFRNNHIEQFLLCFPPPNVTGKLHLGHAFTVAIEDTLTRWNRMKGKKVAWIPGYDHAGIATQVQVEKKLWKEKRLRSIDLSRDEFIDECQQWKEDRINDINKQLKLMGASLDWNKTYYTMDTNFRRAVIKAFCLLHSDGLIFRDIRLVNWCPHLRSAISDQEVETISILEPTEMTFVDRSVSVGWLYFVKYPLVDSCGDTRFITVATTRPETILADVAIAVNPRDERFSSLIGQRVRNPLLPDLIFQVVADDAVEMNLGTGALKITPAHDFTDFDIGKRHNLPLNEGCLDESARITKKYPDFEGMDRFEAREKILNVLSDKGFLLDRRAHPTNLPVCSRTGDLIEPMLKEQWFMNCKEMSENVLKCVDNGQLRLIPDFLEQHLRHWIERTEDWCLSRQILWGHQIPAYKYRTDWTVAESKDDALEYFRKLHSDASISNESIIQDNDVLDTWFSSALVPLVVNGWPDVDLSSRKGVFPLNLMETGHDILGFWVIRMVMMSLKLTGQVPFPEVFLHGLLRDGQGRKMSKSLGNVIDPIDVIYGKQLNQLEIGLRKATGLSQNEIEIAVTNLRRDFPKGLERCGADALRLALLRHDATSLHVNIDINLTVRSRHFCNKLWNAFKLCQTLWHQAPPTVNIEPINVETIGSDDRWMLSRLWCLVDDVEGRMNKYLLHNVSSNLVEFLWQEFCDVYLELIKPPMRSGDFPAMIAKSNVCHLVLEVFLRLLAPITPYVCEELYGRLPHPHTISVHAAQYPTSDALPFYDSCLEEQMKFVLKLVSETRSLRKSFLINNKTHLNGTLVCPEECRSGVQRFPHVLLTLANISIDSFLSPTDYANDVKSSCVGTFVSEHAQLFVRLQDVDKNAVMDRLEKDLEKRTKRIGQLTAKQRKWNAIEGKKRSVEKAQKKVEYSINTISQLESEIERLNDMISSLK